MAFCINCGQELAEGAKFCANCGKAVGGNSSNSQRKTAYDGEIHKCPNCGEIVEAFTGTCSSCGYELRDTKPSHSILEFVTKLESIELQREKTATPFSFSKFFTEESISSTNEQKINLIRSFAIPNTKEDIYEFMILAASNIDLQVYGFGDQGILTASRKAISDAWMAKFEQAYQKAFLVFGSSSDFQSIKVLYNTKMKQVKRKKGSVITLISILGALTIGIPLLVLFLTGTI